MANTFFKDSKLNEKFREASKEEVIREVGEMISYRYRDKEKRREYMKQLMRRKRDEV